MTEFMWTPPEREKINNAVDEAVDSLTRIQAEKDHMKDIVEVLKEDVGMKPALFNALVKQRFESSSSKNLEKHEEIVELDDLLKTSTVVSPSAATVGGYGAESESEDGDQDEESSEETEGNSVGNGFDPSSCEEEEEEGY